MTDIATNLRRTRADMLGTNDEEHYWHCHEAADEIEHLRNRIARAMVEDADQKAEIERLQAEFIESCKGQQETERLLQQTIERLQAALERIANEYIYEPEGDALMFQRWAREALNDDVEYAPNGMAYDD